MIYFATIEEALDHAYRKGRHEGYAEGYAEGRDKTLAKQPRDTLRCTGR